MKKNAFTLVELLGVIAILGLIVLIAIPTVEKNIKSGKQKMYETQVSNIESGIRDWATDNLFILPDNENEIITLTLYQLKQGGYVEKNIMNPLNDELFPNDMLLTITKKNNSFKYAVLTNTGTQTGTAEINPDDPTLILNGLPVQYVEIYDLYTDLGVIALDSEGNLIDQSNVVTTISGSGNSIDTDTFGNYTVKYQVTDPDNGYKTTVMRSVIVSDITKPSLSIPSSIALAPTDVSSFNPRTGATAIDNYDGDLTNQIQITGNLSILPGTYYLSYKVTDSSGNSITAKRKIVVNLTYAYYDSAKGVNKPQLFSGMTPIKWNGTSWENTTEDDSEWYNYTTADKKWANAKTADGSFWVWIPRYVYKISTEWHSATAGTIDIKFSMDTDDTRNGTITLDTAIGSSASNNKWTNHPAFTFGTTELAGIWVAKFEPSVSNTSDACYTTPNATNCNKDTLTPKFVPNVKAWNWLNVNNMFNVSRNMETNSVYGWGTSGIGLDTHLMKNIEWGAAVYFAHSAYGKNNEIWANNSSTYITGCAGNSVAEALFAGCQNEYQTANGQQASTTGNVYGIYDMSDGASEVAAAYLNNGTANLATNGNSLINANSKYKDIYDVGNPDLAANNYPLAANNKKGEAVYETSGYHFAYNASWYGKSGYLVATTSPWFSRGSRGTFSFDSTTGAASDGISFRPTLVATPPPTYVYNEGVNSDAWDVGNETNSTYITITRTKEATDLLTTVRSTDDYTAGSATWVTSNPIDLTGYSTLKIDALYTGVCNYMTLKVGGSKNTNQPEDPSTVINCGGLPSNTRFISTLDISNMNGNFYIKFILTIRGLDNGTTKLYKVWLEK